MGFLKGMAAALRPMVICGPSGSGKSTLLELLFKEYENKFSFCVSHTTRNPRPGEQNGVHYHFTNKETMQNSIDNGEFIENATFGGNLYGTSKAALDKVMSEGKVCILDIETQGVKQVKESDYNFHYVFVKPPSVEHLKQRLMARKTETEESLKLRLSHALAEIEYGTTPGNFDIIIVNDNLEHAYCDFKQFVDEHVLPK